MAIKIKTLPKIEIMGKEYTIGFETSNKSIDSLQEMQEEMQEFKGTFQEQVAFTRGKVKIITDTLLYDGAFDEIFEPFGNTVGMGSYLEFINDLSNEVKAQYDTMGKSMDKITKVLKQAEERKQSK